VETQQLIQATCPECRGPLTEAREEHLREYRCLVGHAYSPSSLLQAHSETQERALWAAVVALEEAAKLVDAIAPQFPPEIADRLQTQARIKSQQALEIREIIEELEPFHTGS